MEAHILDLAALGAILWRDSIFNPGGGHSGPKRAPAGLQEAHRACHDPSLS